MNKALLIGVNKYIYPGQDLNGCLNDCKVIYDTLVNTQNGIFQFRPEEVRYLFDENATKDNILWGLDWITKDRNPGDKTLVYYSGHGSRVPDKTGKEADGYTEILCPTDIHKYWNNPLKDSDVESYVMQLPREGKNLIIFDCCHSGTAVMSRYANIQGFFQQGGELRKKRYLPCPPEFGGEALQYIPSIGIGKRSASFETMTNYHIDDSLPYVYFSGCRDNEYSNEIGINGISSGVMTYVLTSLLKQYPQASSQQIFTAMGQWFQKDYQWLDQHPQYHSSTFAYNNTLL